MTAYSSMPLEVLKTGPKEPVDGMPTLVFAHGAFAGAWIWLGGFLQFFAERGYPCVAFGFRGHANDDPHQPPHGIGLDQYVADIKEVVAGIDGPAVIVAHSMGGLVAQMALGTVRPRALCLLAPAPIEGMAWSNTQLAFSDPRLWMAAIQTALEPHSATPDMTRRAMLSEDAPQTMVEAIFSRLRAEPTLALSQAQMPQPAISAQSLGIPTLVVRGTSDKLIPDDVCMRTALYHGARYERLPDIAHGLMVDTQWARCAALIDDWLKDVAVSA